MGALPAGGAAAFSRDGILFPLPVLSEDEVAALRARLEGFERASADAADILRHKGHLVLPWLADLIRHPRILDAVEELLGPDLLCWTTNAFLKSPGDGRIVSWHQDATYWGLSSDEVVTAWVALSPSTPESGCMRVVPGSHRLAQQPHNDTFAANNLLTRGQEIAVDVDEAAALDVVLRPGEMSLHHVLIVHGSGPNVSADRRLGIAIRYIPTHIRQTSGLRDSATLVRGTDRYGNFRPEMAPAADDDPAARIHWEDAKSASAQILYAADRRNQEDGSTG